MPTIDETETTVSYDHRGRVYRVWTNYAPHQRKIEAMVDQGRATKVNDKNYVIPAEHYDFRRGFKTKRRALTDEQRQALADRLQSNRRADGKLG